MSPVTAPATDKWYGVKEVGIEKEIKKELSLLERYLKLDGKHGGQCVEFIQNQLNTYYEHPEFSGVAGTIKPNSDRPEIGSVVITSEGKVGHVAIIVGMDGDYLILAESNVFDNDEIIRVGRYLKKDNEHIIGYFNF